MKKTIQRISQLALLLFTIIIISYSCKKDTKVVIPVLITNGISSINQSTATSGGNISSDGGATVTVRGVCWSTSQNPTIANSKTTDGTGIGIYASSITGLTQLTTYYVRAYATNSAGTGYGNQLSFTTAAAMPTIGLLAWYPFNNNGLDSSGNNNNGIIYGPTATTDRFNHANQALLFSGNNQYISVANDVYSSNLTLSSWMYANDFGGTGNSGGKVIFFKATSTGYNIDYDLGVGLDASSNAVAFFNFGQGSSQYVGLLSNTILQASHWYLITATRENGVANLYINGNLDATTTYSFTPADENFNLTLGMSNNSFQSFSGKLDELRIYNRALTATEIQTLYHEGGYK